MENELENEEIINCHSHIFTIDHVPEFFAKSLVPGFVEKIFTIPNVKWFYQNFTIEGSKTYKEFVRRKDKLKYAVIDILKFTVVLWWVYSIVLVIIRQLFKIFVNIFQLNFLVSKELKILIERYLIMARYSIKYENQRSIFIFLKKLYPKNTKFVVLPMDMEYMAAGKPKISYMKQLEGLITLSKKNSNLLPFVFVDPHRIAETSQNTGNENFANYVRQGFEDKVFKGIKIYPALGYYPFDKDLIDLFLYAQEKQIPIMTHCIKGTVFYRGEKKEKWSEHPILEYNVKGGVMKKIPLPQTENSLFTTNFTHPLNYHCLMDKNLLSKYLGREVDLKGLKMCIGHFGGDDEWQEYDKNVWVDYNNLISLQSKASYQKGNNTLDNYSKRTIWWNASWLSIVYDLMIKYENIYADISFILYQESMFPTLKYLLEDPKIKHKILFGTDFYLVSQKNSDKELWQTLRGYLGKEMFEMIAVTNPKAYLRIRL
jgi:predicted TIM-barrel fold metal-dependent hydrolase